MRLTDGKGHRSPVPTMMPASGSMPGSKAGWKPRIPGIFPTSYRTFSWKGRNRAGRPDKNRRFLLTASVIASSFGLAILFHQRSQVPLSLSTPQCRFKSTSAKHSSQPLLRFLQSSFPHLRMKQRADCKQTCFILRKAGALSQIAMFHRSSSVITT